MKQQTTEKSPYPGISEKEIALLSCIKESTAHGFNVEIRRKGDGYSIKEVSKRNIEL